MAPKKIKITEKISKNSIDKAGIFISKSNDYSSEGYEKSFDIINTWRGLHTYPLNTFQAGLRISIDSLGLPKNEFFVSQRLKRIVSIIAKLKTLSQTQLSRMQDIGGIRAVLPSKEYVYKIKEKYMSSKSTKTYSLIRIKDYIEEPKEDGYRGIHLVFVYENKRYPQTEGLTFEFQIRTIIQHARATAVETIGTFISASLKSNEGPEERLEYFRYVSAGLSYIEGTKIHERFNDKSPKQIIDHIIDLTEKLKVKHKIGGFSMAAQVIKNEIQKTKKGAKIFLIVLDTKVQSLAITSFGAKEKQKALAAYKSMEEEALKDSTIVVVLVSIDKVNDLQKAYPSYFGDNQLFLDYLKAIENYGK